MYKLYIYINEKFMEIQSNVVIDYSPWFNGNIIYKHDIFQQAMSDYQMVSKKNIVVYLIAWFTQQPG